MATVLVLGTLDTKGAEFTWMRERLAEHGVDALLMDVGTFSHSDLADVTSDEVIEAAGENPQEVREGGDRGRAMAVMARGAGRLARRLVDEGRVHGLLGAGGSGGSSVVGGVMQALPIGVPKLLVSTMASGNVQPYIGDVDAAIMYSVVDVAGVNDVSAQIFDNACAGIAGMARAYEGRRDHPVDAPSRPVIAMTMFGLTTPAADEARQRLTDLGYEVLVFHATGAGGRAMEKLVESGMVAGVLDLTTTELADDLVGGVLSAGPHRLEKAGSCAVPQVVSVGALDMVNFGPRETVPERFDGRTFVVHNPTVTLMRTTPDEMAELGRRIAVKLAAASGPTSVHLPLRGVSGIDVDGGPFRDAQADAKLFDAIRDGLAGTDVRVEEADLAINDPGFGRAMADDLHGLVTAATH
ncbi:Tm-1-like ATP-binding domain-containing protein [Acidipropionibacterium timonense]|uniref:Tm-1-like ATP-binding domain-containing protein n=1 Tax=Acidipropionibacterium timonense TaxID=2161818 RepID=UPI00103092CB|nr:Tm-1-like ATP-binding domain-containing protein [Acidipropionibacterium timonense]